MALLNLQAESSPAQPVPSDPSGEAPVPARQMPVLYRRLPLALPSWLAAMLARVQSVFPSAVIAGGAPSALLMDYLDGRPLPQSMAELRTEDLDFFVPLGENNWDLDVVASRVEQIPGVRAVKCTELEQLRSFGYERYMIAFVVSFALEGVPCQVVVHRGNITRRVLEFDFTLRQCYHRGDGWLWVSAAGLADLKARVLRIANPFRPLRTLRRTARFVRRYGMQVDPQSLAITLDLLQHNCRYPPAAIRRQISDLEPTEHAWLQRYLAVDDDAVTIRLPAPLPGTPLLRACLYGAGAEAEGCQGWLYSWWQQQRETRSALIVPTTPAEGTGVFADLTGTTVFDLPAALQRDSRMEFCNTLKLVDWWGLSPYIAQRKDLALRAQFASVPNAEETDSYQFVCAKHQREQARLRGIHEALCQLTASEYESGQLEAGKIPYYQSRGVAGALYCLIRTIERWMPEEQQALAALNTAARIFHDRTRHLDRAALTISTRWEDLMGISTNKPWKTCMTAGEPTSWSLIANLEPGCCAVAILHEPGQTRWLGRVLLRALDDGRVAIERFYGIGALEPVLAYALGERLASAGKLPGMRGRSVPFTWLPPYTDSPNFKTLREDGETVICYDKTVPFGWQAYSPHFKTADPDGALAQSDCTPAPPAVG